MLPDELIYRPQYNQETDPIAVIVHIHGTPDDAITLEFDDYQINMSVGAAASLATTIHSALGGYRRMSTTQNNQEN